MKFSLIFLLLLNIWNGKINNNYNNINNSSFTYFKKISLNNYKSSTLYKVSNDGNIIWFIAADNYLYQQNLILNTIIKIDINNIGNIEQLKMTNDGSAAWIFTYSKKLYFVNDQSEIILVQQNLVNNFDFVLSNNGLKCWYINNGIIQNFDSTTKTENSILQINNAIKIQISNDGNIIWFLDNNLILNQYNLSNNKMINYKINNIEDFKISLDGNIAISYDVNNKIYRIENSQLEFNSLNDLNKIIENFKIDANAFIGYFYYSDFTIYKLDNNMNLINVNLTQKIVNYNLTKQNDYLWMYTKNLLEINLYVVDSFQNLHQLALNLKYENSTIEFSADGRKIFILDQDYNLYELDFEITELLKLNADYVYKDNSYYYSNNQIMYLNNNYLSSAMINNQIVDLNKTYVIDKDNAINLKLNADLIKYNFLFTNNVNDNQTINMNLSIDSKITDNEILFNSSQNNLIIKLGYGATNSNINNCEVIGVYLNNSNILDIDFNFSNIKLLDYSNSFIQLGVIDANKNFNSKHEKQYINNASISLTSKGVYELFLSDLLGNKYIEYVELGLVDNQFNLNWQTSDFINKLNKFNINISDEIINETNEQKNIDYNKIYYWLNSYQIYFMSQFMNLFTSEVNDFKLKTGFNLNDKYLYYVNNIWNEINKFAIPTIITQNMLKNLLLYNPKINFDAIKINLEANLSKDIINIINSKINSVTNIANAENVIVKNINNNNDLNDYLKYVNNYNNYLNQNFNQLVQTDLTNLNNSNVQLQNMIIQNRKNYLNLIEWNSKINQNNFSTNINNQKIIKVIKDFNENIKKHRHKIWTIFISLCITIPIVLITIIILIYRNKAYIKMKFSKSGREKLKKSNKNRIE